MAEKEYIGWALKCDCCEGMLIAQRPDRVEHYLVFPSKTLAEIEASENGNQGVIRVKVTILKDDTR